MRKFYIHNSLLYLTLSVVGTVVGFETRTRVMLCILGSLSLFTGLRMEE